MRQCSRASAEVLVRTRYSRDCAPIVRVTVHPCVRVTVRVQKRGAEWVFGCACVGSKCVHAVVHAHLHARVHGRAH
eukprot:3999000-Pleurochrysis_carterae.AAC.2